MPGLHAWSTAVRAGEHLWGCPCKAHGRADQHPHGRPHRREPGWRAAAPKGRRNSLGLPAGAPASTSKALVKPQGSPAIGGDEPVLGRQWGSACMGWSRSCQSSDRSQLAAPRHLPGDRPPPPSTLQGSQLTANGQQHPSRRLIIFLGCREIVISNYPHTAAEAPTGQCGTHSPAAPRSGQAGRDPGSNPRVWWEHSRQRPRREGAGAMCQESRQESYVLKVGSVARQQNTVILGGA